MAEAIIADMNASGIYQIRNLLNGKRYIGSAKCFRIRWNAHRAFLRKGKHHSRHLQASWIRYGDAAFSFEVIEACPAHSLIDREQIWIDLFQPAYNICGVAGSTLGRVCSDSTKNKIAAKAIGRKLPPRTAEYKAKASSRMIGRKMTPEQHEALQAGRAARIFTEEQKLRLSVVIKSQYQDGTRNRDRPQSYRDKIAATLRGRTLPEEVRNKIGLALKGRKRAPYNISPAAMEKLREAGKRLAASRIGKKLSQESIAKMSASLRGKRQSAETILKRSNSLRAAWARRKGKIPVNNKAMIDIQIKALDDDARTLEGWATRPDEDRTGDIVLPRGATYSLPLPFLLDHDHRKNVGQVDRVDVSSKGIKFFAHIAKISEPGEVKDLCDSAWALIKNGLRRAVSIGFRSLDAEQIPNSYGVIYNKWEWLELSAVTVPALASAQITGFKSIAGHTLVTSASSRIPGGPVQLIQTMKTAAEKLPGGAVRLIHSK